MIEAQLDKSLAHYAALASRYDHFTRRIDGIRARAIAALDLRAGQTVLDAGCGTGWCIPKLAQAVAPGGRVIGFDPSPEMLALARARSAAVEVQLLHASALEVSLDAPVDAILLSYTHDLIRSPPALDHVLGLAKPGARVAATSTKLYASWLAPLNAYLRWSHRGYITNFEGFDAPWSLLAARLDDFRLVTRPWSQHYIATGSVRAQRA